MNLLDRWVSLLKPFGFSQRFVKWSFLTGISALLENRCYMYDHGGGVVYPTLYCLLVGAPATFKTTTCDRMYYDLIKPIATENEGPWFGPSICTPQQMVHIFRRHNQRNVANDHKSSPMFVYAGEFNTFYRDIGGGEITVDLLNFYDPKPLGEHWAKETVKDGRLEVISPALTLLGCTTQKNIIESKMMTVSGTGIVSRFIFVYEPKRPNGCSDRPSIQDSQELKVLRACCQVIRSLKGEFRLTPDAEKLLKDYMIIERRWHHENPADTLFAHYMARRGTQLRKLAMIISACSRNNLVIDKQDLVAANQLLADIEPDMPQAFGAQILKGDPGLMMKLADRIPPDGITEAELLQLFVADGQMVPKDFDYYAAIDGLLGLHFIKRHENKKTGVIHFKRCK